MSCDYHDAAAALVIDGKVVAAAEEERFSRIKHDASIPKHAVASCLAIAGIPADAIDVVVQHEKPLAVLSRVVAARQRRGPRALPSFAREMPKLIGTNLMVGYRIERMMRELGASRPPTIRYGEHHLSHAAAAFLPSPFPSAAILTIDGLGEWATATIGQGFGGRVEIREEVRYPNSLGLLYSLVTRWCGFQPNDGEFKLMGLSPFGEPSYLEDLRAIIEVHDDGSLKIDARAVDWWSSRRASMKTLSVLVGEEPRGKGEALRTCDVDLARSVQQLTEEAILKMAQRAAESTGERQLCMAGGVALNCVANGRVLREGPFDDVWVQPAAGDAGSALGAALWYWNDQCGNARAPLSRASEDHMRGAALGPEFGAGEVADWLIREGIPHIRVSDLDERNETVAARLAAGSIVGWFQGRMEFGPRALGHRSILADPRSSTVQRDINIRVKGRETFRPFAPAVLAEHATEWFDMDRESPYMLFTFPVAKSQRVAIDVEEPFDPVARVQIARSSLPACTHIDGSARVQTVDSRRSPQFHALIAAFYEQTGCPAVVNTSFNRAGEPIVCTPDDALRSAQAADLDLLVMEDSLIEIADTIPA